MEEILRKLYRDEDGQGLVEYALILLLVALAAIIGIKALGDANKKLFDNIAEEMVPK